MTHSLIRRLVLAAVVLAASTLGAVDYTLTVYSSKLTGAPVDPSVRLRVLAIALGAAALASLVAILVSRSLTMRVSRLKRAAEGLLGGEAPGVALDSSDDLASLERSLGGVGKELRTLVSNLRF